MSRSLLRRFAHFWSRPSVPQKSAGRYWPILERLETLIMPTLGYRDFAGLRFTNPTIDSEQTVINLTGGSVVVGFTPESNDAFVGLMEVDLGSSGTLEMDTTSTPQVFTIDNASLVAIVQGTSAKFYNTPAAPLAINIPQLIGQDGFAVTPSVLTQVPLPGFDGVQFEMTNIGLALDDPFTGEDLPQIDIQGFLTFDAVPALKIGMDNENLLVADKNGFRLTGVDAHLASPDLSKDELGLKDVSLNAGYTNENGDHRFTITGGVTFSTKEQGPNNQRALDGVGGTLGLVIENGVIKGFDIGVTGAINIAGLNVQISNGDFKYVPSADHFEAAGDLYVTIKPSDPNSTNGFYFNGRLGYANGDAGLIINDGELETLNVLINTEITIFALTATTNGAGISLAFDKTTGEYTAYGSLSFVINSGKPSSQDLTVTMGTDVAPGLVYDHGLKSLGFTIDFENRNSVDIEGLGLTPKDKDVGLGITWSDLVSPTNPQGRDLLIIKGDVTINGLSQVEVSLGSGSQPGIEILDGKFHLDDFTIQVEHVKFGSAFQLRDLNISYTTSSAGYSLDVAITVIFPAGWALEGSLDLLNGKLNSISVGLNFGLEPIPVGDTGFFVTYVSLSVQNVQLPDDLVFEGRVAVTYGETTQIGSNDDVTIVAATGDVKIDRNQFYLTGGLYVGAQSNGTTPLGEPIYIGVIAQATGTLNLDWGAKIYSASVHANFLEGVFIVDGGFTFSSSPTTTSLLIYADAYVEIPTVVPVIGGKKIAGMNFVFDYRRSFDVVSGFAAAWVELDVIYTIDFGFEYDITTGDFSLLGSKGVAAIEACVTDPGCCPTTPPNQYLYAKAFTVPTGATGATFSVQLPRRIGTQQLFITPSTSGSSPIPSSDFDVDTNHLSLVPELGDTTRYQVNVVGSHTDTTVTLPPGEYTFAMISDVPINENDLVWSSGFLFQRPTISIGAIGTQVGSVAPVALSGVVASVRAANAKVTLYVDSNNTGYDGAPVASAQDVPFDANGFVAPWDVTGLLPVDYYLYAVIDDGVNRPVFSEYSQAFSPTPPLSGTVTDIGDGRNDGVGGITVFIDADSNGFYDVGELTTTTSPVGFFEFYDIAPNASYRVHVIAPAGVVLVSPNPQVVTYGSTVSPQNLTFDVKVETSIRGSVTHAAGVQAGQSGITVYLDLNDNGEIDANEPRTSTLVDGSYQIFDVEPNTTYTVRMDTTSSSFTNNYYTTAATNSGPKTVTTPSDPFGQVVGVDFGLLSLSVISGTVSGYPIEQNGDLNTTTTVSLKDWTVNLLQNGQIVATTTTDASGVYQFKVPAGNYTIEQVVQTGWLPHKPATPVFAVDSSSTSVPIPFYADNPNGVDTVQGVGFADFDADGFLDMVTSSFDYYGNGHTLIFWGSSSGTYSQNDMLDLGTSQGGGTVLVANLTSARPDIVVYFPQAANNVNWYVNGGNRNFSNTGTWQVSNNSNVVDLAAADFDGDGLDDLAALYAENSNSGDAGLRVRLSKNGSVSYQTGLDSVYDLAAGDVNADGKFDLVLSAERDGSHMILALGDGTGQFALRDQNTQRQNQQAVSLGDLQDNDLLDAAFFNVQTNQIQYLQYQGAGIYGSYTGGNDLSPTYDNPLAFQTFLADVNGDFRPDLVVAGLSNFVGSSQTQYIWFRVWLNQKSGGYFNAQPDAAWEYVASPNLFPNNDEIPNPYFALADVNGDGLPDFVVGDSGTGNVEIFYNQTTFTKTAIAVSLVPEQSAKSQNFLNGQVAAVNGSVHDDLNRNGTIEAGEPGLAGQTVYLDLDKNGRYDPGVDRLATTTTGGLFRFANVPDGEYGIGLLSQPDRKATGAGAWQTLTIANGQPTQELVFTSAKRLLAGVANPTVAEGNELTFTVPLSATPTKHAPIYRLDNAPASAIIDDLTGVITWTPSGVLPTGNYEMTVRVTDPFDPSQSDTQTVVVAVESSPAYTFVRNLYADVLGRAADEAGYAAWIGALANGMSRAQAASQFWTSAEHRGIQVASYYTLYLGRASDVAERAGWVAAFLGGSSETDVILAFVTSSEYQTRHAGVTPYLTALYEQILDRTPDAAGLNAFVEAAAAGTPLSSLARDILFSEEASVVWLNGQYQKFFGRDADLAGGLAWLRRLQAGATRSAVAEALLESDEFYGD